MLLKLLVTVLALCSRVGCGSAYTLSGCHGSYGDPANNTCRRYGGQYGGYQGSGSPTYGRWVRKR